MTSERMQWMDGQSVLLPVCLVILFSRCQIFTLLDGSAVTGTEQKNGQAAPASSVG